MRLTTAILTTGLIPALLIRLRHSRHHRSIQIIGIITLVAAISATGIAAHADSDLERFAATAHQRAIEQGISDSAAADQIAQALTPANTPQHLCLTYECDDHPSNPAQGQRYAWALHVTGDPWRASLFDRSDWEPVMFGWLNCTVYYESRWNPNATNRNSNGTVDKGLTQINHYGAVWSPPGNSWYSHFGSPFDPAENLRMAHAIYYGFSARGYRWPGQGAYGWSTAKYCASWAV
jgi:hypothetical protein